MALIQPDDLPRFGPLGVISVLRPYETRPSPGRVDAWVDAVGEDRTARAWPGGTIAAAKGRVVFGTGWPKAPLHPLSAIHAAVNRSDELAPEATWNAAESISLKRAIDAFTLAPAYASFDEKRKGSLKAGMLADLVVLSNDIFSAPASRISSTTLAVTIFDGKIVYRRNAKSTD